MSFRIRGRDLMVAVTLVSVGLFAGLALRPTESLAQAQGRVCQVASGGPNSAYVACGERVFVCEGSQCVSAFFR